METEIIATSAIENIDFSRDSVRSILSGQASKNEEERRISYVAATRAKDNLFWLIAKPIRRRKKPILSFIEF